MGKTPFSKGFAQVFITHQKKNSVFKTKTELILMCNFLRIFMNKIFFHFGPGGNPYVDQALINDDSIYFWNQPNAQKDIQYIPYLVDSANREVMKLAEKNETIEIITHSIGAFIAMNLSDEALEKVSKITFIAPTYNFTNASINIASTVAANTNDEELSEHVLKMKTEPTSANFLAMFTRMSQIQPDYMKYYWAKDENQLKYNEIASQHDPLDENTLVTSAIELVDFYNKDLNEYKRFNCETRVILGDCDPLLDDNEKSEIESFFGSENVQRINAGHFPHCEQEIIF